MPRATPAFTTDPAAAYPELVSLRSALQAGDWSAVRAVADGLDPDGRSVLIRLAGDVPGAAPFLDARLKDDPADTLAAALRAAGLIHEAWQVRTAARAQYVSREQFQRFHEILRRAEPLLIDAAAHDPTAAAVWVHRLITARGLELGQSEARRRYDRLAEHHPHHLPGQSQLLQQLCPKWGGSFDEVHAFARKEMLAAPEGAPNGVLVAEAHLEQASDTADEKALRRYFKDRRVREEIREAAARSVLHPAYRPTVGWVDVRNTFALMLSLVGDFPAAAQQFAAVGHLVSELPWGYLGEPVAVFREHRARALRKGGHR
jgi:hypothetical protein